MPTFTVIDPATGKPIRVVGDSPPTDAEKAQIVQAMRPQGVPPSTFEHGTSTPPTTLQSWMSSPGGRVFRGIADPALGLASTAGDLGKYTSTFGGKLPNPIGDYFGGMSGAANWVRKGIDSSWDTANASARSTPGYQAIAPQMNQNIADNSGSTAGYLKNFAGQIAAPVLPGLVGGLGYADQAIHNLPNDLTGGSVVTAADRANAAADATHNQLEAWQQANPLTSLGAAIAPALAGFVGDVPGAAANLLKTGRLSSAVPTIAALKAAARAAYDRVDASGMRISEKAVNGMVDNLRPILAEAGLDPKQIPVETLQQLYPNTVAILRHLENYRTGDKSLTALDALKKIINDATQGTTKADQRLVRIIGDHVDDFVDNLDRTQVVNGGTKGALVPIGTAEARAQGSGWDPNAINALNNARSLWTRASKGQMIEDLLTKAANRAGNNQGVENAIRTQFRNLANNERGMARFTADEQAAIQDVARGGSTQFSLRNLLRKLGKLSPDTPGQWGSMASIAIGAGGAATGNPATMLVPLAGATAKATSLGLTKAAARNVQRMVLSGGRAGRAPELGPGILAPYQIPWNSMMLPPLLLQQQQQQNEDNMTPDQKQRALLGGLLRNPQTQGAR